MKIAKSSNSRWHYKRLLPRCMLRMNSLRLYEHTYAFWNLKENSSFAAFNGYLSHSDVGSNVAHVACVGHAIPG